LIQERAVEEMPNQDERHSRRINMIYSVKSSK